MPARIVAEGQSSFHLAGCRAPLGDLTGQLLGSLVEGRASRRRRLGRRHRRRRSRVDSTRARAAHDAAAPRRRHARRAAGRCRQRGRVLRRDGREPRVQRAPARALHDAPCANSGAEPVIVLNKVDLEADLAPLLEAIGRAAIGVPVVRASAASGEGVEELRSYIGSGKTVGFIGSSGVGKSSLTNRLLGREAQAVGGLRNDERGRHTTTARQLIELPGRRRAHRYARACASSACSTTSAESRRASPTSRRSPSAVDFATARTRPSPAAPCSRPTRAASCRPSGSRAIASCWRRSRPPSASAIRFSRRVRRRVERNPSRHARARQDRSEAQALKRLQRASVSRAATSILPNVPSWLNAACL